MGIKERNNIYLESAFLSLDGVISDEWLTSRRLWLDESPQLHTECGSSRRDKCVMIKFTDHRVKEVRQLQ